MLRTWGRSFNADGTRGPWTEVTTDANGNNDLVWTTTLCQVLLLNLNESPFFANYGIPAYQTVTTQVFPDYYVVYTQQLFSQYFATLVVSKVEGTSPVYNVNITTHQGVKLNPMIPIPY